MKKQFVLLGALVSLALIIMGCPSSSDDDDTNGGDNDPEKTVVATLNLTSLVTKPVKGAAPSTTPINTTQYTGTVAWQTEAGGTFTEESFAADTVYKALVTLTAKDDFTFTGVKANSFTYTGATVSNAADSGTVTIAFPATEAENDITPVSELDLTELVKAPKGGEKPVTTAIDTDQYTGTIKWQTDDDEAFSEESFAADTVYKALVTLKVKTGFTFTGVKKNSFTYTDATDVSNAADSGTVTIIFPATEAEKESTPVTKVDLTELVKAPKGGEKPVTTAIDTDQYTGTIKWQTDDDKDFTGESFVAGAVYKALVTLKVKTGFTFTGIPIASFSHTGATGVTNAESTDTVTISITITFKPAANATGNATPPVLQATFSGLPEDETITLTELDSSLSGKANTELLISVTDPDNLFEAAYEWYKDEEKQAGTGNSLTLHAQDFSLGWHTVSVKVKAKADSQSYSKTVRFKIEK